MFLLFNKKLKETIYQVGLFWFSKDYSEIIRIEGVKNINNSDLLKSGRVDPIGLHAEYSMPRDMPRGRICYENKIFKIWIGEDNPLSDDSIINLIKPHFELVKLTSNNFKVVHHYHWNTKN